MKIRMLSKLGTVFSHWGSKKQSLKVFLTAQE